MKQEGIHQGLQGGFQAGVCKASSWDVQWVAGSEGLDRVEGLASSEPEELTRSIIVRGARKVGAPATQHSFAQPLERKNSG
jgi:hypothetical protein